MIHTRKTIVYLSDPSPGIRTTGETFGKEQRELEQKGYVVLNPAILPGAWSRRTTWRSVPPCLCGRTWCTCWRDGWTAGGQCGDAPGAGCRKERRRRSHAGNGGGL